MVISASGPIQSPFLALYLPLFMDRFSLSCERDGSCIAYYLYRREGNHQISKNLMVSHDSFARGLHVSRFYPEIYLELNCRYLSAACFYIMIHHAARTFHLPDNCCVYLETELSVFAEFYSRLLDFGFQVMYRRSPDRVCVRGHYREFPFGTDAIRCVVTPPS